MHWLNLYDKFCVLYRCLGLVLLSKSFFILQCINHYSHFDWAAQDEMNMESHNIKTFLVELVQNDFNNVDFFLLVMRYKEWVILWVFDNPDIVLDFCKLSVVQNTMLANLSFCKFYFTNTIHRSSHFLMNSALRSKKRQTFYRFVISKCIFHASWNKVA